MMYLLLRNISKGLADHILQGFRWSRLSFANGEIRGPVGPTLSLEQHAFFQRVANETQQNLCVWVILEEEDLPYPPGDLRNPPKNREGNYQVSHFFWAQKATFYGELHLDGRCIRGRVEISDKYYPGGQVYLLIPEN